MGHPVIDQLNAQLNEMAFPVTVTVGIDGVETPIVAKGLSKKEYFAICALQGLLAAPNRNGIPACVDAAVIAAENLIERLSLRGPPNGT